MADSGLSVNSVVMTIVAIAIGIVLIGSLLAPIADDVMTQLTAKTSEGVAVFADGGTWSTLISVVVVITIVGLILVAVNSYTKKNRGGEKIWLI